jgi:hypothetical protein
MNTPLVKFLACEKRNNTFYYTVENDDVPNIYSMKMTVELLRSANDHFNGAFVGNASIPMVVNALTMHHHTEHCVPLPLCDLFKVAADPEHAGFVSKVYDAQKKHLNQMAIIPTGKSFVFLH